MKRGRCIQCRRRLGSKAEFLYSRPDGTAVYLCGRRSCEVAYNGGAPDPGCDCGAHAHAAASR